jgi:hypothetical protein
MKGEIVGWGNVNGWEWYVKIGLTRARDEHERDSGDVHVVIAAKPEFLTIGSQEVVTRTGESISLSCPLRMSAETGDSGHTKVVWTHKGRRIYANTSGYETVRVSQCQCSSTTTQAR